MNVLANISNYKLINWHLALQLCLLVSQLSLLCVLVDESFSGLSGTGNMVTQLWLGPCQILSNSGWCHLTLHISHLSVSWFDQEHTCLGEWTDFHLYQLELFIRKLLMNKNIYCLKIMWLWRLYLNFSFIVSTNFSNLTVLPNLFYHPLSICKKHFQKTEMKVS